MGDSPQEQGNPEHTAQPAGNSTAWRVSFSWSNPLPGSPSCLRVFGAACLLSESLQLSWSERLLGSWALLLLAERDMGNLVSFREFEAIFVVVKEQGGLF